MGGTPGAGGSDVRGVCVRERFCEMGDVIGSDLLGYHM